MTFTLKDIGAAYDTLLGEPQDKLELRRSVTQAGHPAAIDILFFGPAPEDHLEGDDVFTYVATAGMSIYPIPGACAYAELILGVTGVHDAGALQALGRALADLALQPFRAKIPFAPNVVLCAVDLPLFVAMPCVMLTDWGTYAPEWLPGLDPPVRILAVRPLYEQEASAVEDMGVEAAVAAFTRRDVDLDDPRRPAVHLLPHG